MFKRQGFADKLLPLGSSILKIYVQFCFLRKESQNKVEQGRSFVAGELVA